MLDKLPCLLRENPSFLYGIVAVISIEVVVIVLISQGALTFDKNIGIAVFAGLPVLLLTLLQLYTSSIVQRANLVKDLAARIYTDKELAEAFHYLVYTYDDKTYDNFAAADDNQKEKLNSGRASGKRYFNPQNIDGTEEERKLDTLLGYLDIIAYHHHRRLIPMRDIAGVLGYHLAIIANRKAVTDYRTSIPKFWNNSKFGKEYGAHSAPLRYLDNLLSDYKAFCEKQSRLTL